MDDNARSGVGSRIEVVVPTGTPWLPTLVAGLRASGAHVTVAERTSGEGRVVDLTAEPGAGSWHLAVLEGRPGTGLPALLDSVRVGVLPAVEVRGPDGTVPVSGRPGSEMPGDPELALDDVLAGLALLVVRALEGRAMADPLAIAPRSSAQQPSTRSRGASVVGRRTAGLLVRSAYRRLFLAPHWRVGWRWVAEGEPDVVDLLDHPAQGWHDLPDDGWHFYADPFPFVHEGRTWLFVEDYDHRVGRGVVSVVEMGDDGPLGVPRVVLEHRVHLSYPHVFAHDGQVWMIPETSGAGTVELYRADAFPDRWVLDRVLLEGLEASDATLLEHAGRWWMLATVRHGGSFSDALHAWTAPDPRGPWTAHRANPLLVDIASARPAGRVVLRGDRLVRPVQDNRAGYGAELGLLVVEQLDDDGLEQRPLATLRVGERWPGRRIHTLNRAGRLEVVDGSRLVPRSRALRPLMRRLSSR